MLTTKLSRVEAKLREFESKHSITTRWFPGSVQYHSVKSAMDTKRKHILLSKIKDFARERWFLLALKAKYAGNNL